MAFAHLISDKKGENKGETIYRVRFKTIDGFESKITLGRITKKAAEAERAKIELQVYQGKNPRDERKKKKFISLNDLCRLYLEYSETSHSNKYYEMNDYALRRFQGLHSIPDINTIKPDHVESWLRNMKNESLSEATIGMYYRSVKAMLNWAVKRGYLKESPTRYIKIKRPKQSNNEDFFTKEEIEIILDFIRTNITIDLYRIVKLALETGGRLSELVYLNWSDVNKEMITFQGENTKSGKRRFVPIRPKFKEEFESWRSNNNRIFNNWSSVDPPSRQFTKVLKKLNLYETAKGSRSFHTLRHTFATHNLMNGVNIFIVSRWLGHSSISITDQTYGHLITDVAEPKMPY